MPISSTQNPARPNGRRHWGHPTRLSFWLNSVVLAPLVMSLAVAVGAVVGSALLMLLYLLIGDDARMVGSIWAADSSSFALFGVLSGSLISVLALVMWWIGQTPCAVWTDNEKIVCWSIVGRKTFRWEDVLHATVTIPSRSYEPSSRQTLHLSTEWRDLALPLNRITDASKSSSKRTEQFDDFITVVAEHLSADGKHLEREVPVTSITNSAAPLRYAMFWPHRRVLAKRFHRLNTATTQPNDHHAARPSMALGWMFRPAPVAAVVFGLALLAWVRWGTDGLWWPTALSIGGLLMLAGVPLWNSLKDAVVRARNPNVLMPESMIGQHTLTTELPNRLVPAPACIVDLEKKQVHRPDGKVCGFDEIATVEYGPSKSPGTVRKTLMPTAWHLAVYTKDQPSSPHEIYGNASVDIVRHGDLDPGYAVFNWITCRELARSAEANLILATGRVAGSHVGKSLAERLLEDITRYDPEPLKEELDRNGIQSRVHISATRDRFDAWGPLIRQPEHCATPPIWKIILGVIALGSMFTGFVPAGLVAGYLLAAIIHDVLTYIHFCAPGFTMDQKGVWVRGVCIPWDDFEETTLMPVAPGPILFAGPRTVLITGHLGASYYERAWLGCSAYDWIKQQICKTI